MTTHTDLMETEGVAPQTYTLDGQIGYLLRRAHQRHVSIFTSHMVGNLTPQQFSVLARLGEVGRVSQNELGRQTAMDQSTINGVVQRLLKRALITKHKSASDKRMILLELTEAGRAALGQMTPPALEISRETLAPLSEAEQDHLIGLLQRIC